jgi:RHS repeat-associated protein
MPRRQPRSYTGEQNDPTGLEYLRARYYDKANGRFVSQDPLPLTQGKSHRKLKPKQ